MTIAWKRRNSWLESMLMTLWKGGWAPFVLFWLEGQVLVTSRSRLDLGQDQDIAKSQTQRKQSMHPFEGEWLLPSGVGLGMRIKEF